MLLERPTYEIFAHSIITRIYEATNKTSWREHNGSVILSNGVVYSKSEWKGGQTDVNDSALVTGMCN